MIHTSDTIYIAGNVVALDSPCYIEVLIIVPIIDYIGGGYFIPIFGVMLMFHNLGCRHYNLSEINGDSSSTWVKVAET